MTARLLLLAGSAESVELARVLGARGDIELITQFVGPREAAGPVPGDVRIGRLESASALAEMLDQEKIDLLIDGTHPCLTDLPRLARQAGEAMRTPRLRLIRPMWRRHPLDRWIEVSDVGGAAAVLPRLGRVVMSLLDEADLYALLDESFDNPLIVRLSRPPHRPLPPERVRQLLVEKGLGPVVAETAMLARLEVEALILRAEGGPTLEPAILAAREAGRPVVLLRRPAVDLGERAESVETALVWVDRRLTQLRPRATPIVLAPED